MYSIYLLRPWQLPVLGKLLEAIFMVKFLDVFLTFRERQKNSLNSICVAYVSKRLPKFLSKLYFSGHQSIDLVDWSHGSSVLPHEQELMAEQLLH